MNTIVFCGPTLDRETALNVLPGAQLRGPGQAGDIYLAAKQNPGAIALLDGYFEQRLAVWHKEILWALQQGIAVYGAASMGALRAAELERFGMIGHGAIYEQYASGELEDDDEVAVLHQPAEYGYASSSHALVNIRATLQRAFSEGLIDSGAVMLVIEAAKSLFYPERTFPRVVALASDALGSQRKPLEDWYARSGLVDQKRLDALSLLQHLARHAPLGPIVPRFRFSSTHYWDVFTQTFDRAAVALDPALRLRAHERALALLLAERFGAHPSEQEIQTESERLRRSRGLYTPDATARWLTQNQLDISNFSQLARDNVLVRRFAEQAERLIARQLPSLNALASSDVDDAH